MSPQAKDRRNPETVLAALGVIGGLIFGALALPIAKAGLGLAILLLIWRLIARVRLFDPLRIVAIVLIIGFSTMIYIDSHKDDPSSKPQSNGLSMESAPSPSHEAHPGKILEIDNRAMNGMKTFEDPKPARLTNKAVSGCRDRGCQIKDTDRRSGDSYNAAVCQRQGARITNGSDSSHADDKNPLLFSSHRWYGVRLKGSDTFGYISEVWVSKKDRGGLGLPKC